MSRMRNSIAALATVVMLATGVVVLTPLPAVAIDAEITVPEAPAEHAAEVAKYERESIELEAKAAGHAERAARYKARIKTMSSKQSNAQHGMYKHCERLAKAYRNAASEAREMAKMHREMADQ